MKNELKYYYGLDVKNYIQRNNSFYFDINGSSYIFSYTERNVQEINEIYIINELITKLNILSHEIIINNYNNLVTNINNKNYVLMKNNICSDNKISLNDLIKFSLLTRNEWKNSILNRTNWSSLWINKLQNLEYQVSQFGKSNNIITHLFSYYAGIVENTIQLNKDIYNANYNKLSISHKRITVDTTLNEFYNPLNYIIDYSIRDISEYLKSKIIGNIDICDELMYCLKIKTYNNYEKQLLINRMLYPSYQLDAYENYFFDKNNIYKNKLESYLINSEKYEINIKKIYAFSLAYISNLPYINWLDYNHQIH